MRKQRYKPKVKISKQPIIVDCVSALSANDFIFNEIYTYGCTEVQNMVLPEIDYCNQRLSGTYPMSGDPTYNNSMAHILQTNKDVLENYMIKKYLYFKEGQLETEFNNKEPSTLDDFEAEYLRFIDELKKKGK